MQAADLPMVETTSFPSNAPVKLRKRDAKALNKKQLRLTAFIRRSSTLISEERGEEEAKTEATSVDQLCERLYLRLPASEASLMCTDSYYMYIAATISTGSGRCSSIMYVVALNSLQKVHEVAEVGLLLSCTSVLKEGLDDVLFVLVSVKEGSTNKIKVYEKEITG